MRVMVVGSGGREHAIAWKIKQSPMVDELFCAPGNAGTAELAANLQADLTDVSQVVALAKKHSIDLTVVGPEAPLSLGLADALRGEGLLVFGPSKAGAAIETSKVFAKELMAENGMPTADYEVFEDVKEARSYIEARGLPVVVKADGLAAGKGAFVCRVWEDVDEALNATLIEGHLGEAGKRILVEDFLEGQEASVVVITDGTTVVPLPASEDHKQLLDGDRGPNTGGMGAFSPTDVLNERLRKRVMSEVMERAVTGLRREGIAYRGALYAGLMIVDGEPFVLEFNCRFGDPETQATFPRIKGDLLPILLAAAEGSLADMKLEVEDNHCVSVVLASGGYPGKYQKGLEISGLSDVERLEDVFVFHAGTALLDGKVVTSGGRVLGVTAVGGTKREALDRAYGAVDRIHFEGMYFRRDIGMRRGN